MEKMKTCGPSGGIILTHTHVTILFFPRNGPRHVGVLRFPVLKTSRCRVLVFDASSIGVAAAAGWQIYASVNFLPLFEQRFPNENHKLSTLGRLMRGVGVSLFTLGGQHLPKGSQPRGLFRGRNQRTKLHVFAFWEARCRMHTGQT